MTVVAVEVSYKGPSWSAARRTILVILRPGEDLYARVTEQVAAEVGADVAVTIIEKIILMEQP